MCGKSDALDLKVCLDLDGIPKILWVWVQIAHDSSAWIVSTWESTYVYMYVFLDSKHSLLSPYLMYSTENNTDSKHSLLSPYLMYSTENNTDSKYSLLSPYLMYSTENDTGSKHF